MLRRTDMKPVKYRSSLGEEKTYEDWYVWAVNFYNEINPDQKIAPMPSDWWVRLVRVFELEKV
jgi:hypothetical protein